MMNHSNSTSSVNENDYGNTSDSSTAQPQQQPSSSQKPERSPLPDNSEAAQQSTNERKNANPTYPTEGAMFFKILVPSAAAGAIIGKGGETIALLQQQTDTRIKMSKATDYFPGTNERVCIIYGPTPDSILQVYDFIAQKIREKPEPGLQQKPASPEYEQKQPSNERDKQVKILVPNSTAGMIIGKAGNYIKHIKDASGAYVQISQKARDHAITERCITVIGDTVQNKNACALILAKIFEDPVSNSCPNLSYADVIGPVPNYNPTGSPFASVQHGGHGGHADHLMAGPYMHANIQNNFFANLRSTLRLAGYTEEATAEIIAAMSTLASYGILGLGLGLGGMGVSPYMSGLAGMHGNQASMDSGFGHSTGSSLAGNISSSSAGGSPGGYADGMSSSMSGASKSPVRYGGLTGQDSLESSYNGQYDQQVPNGAQSKQGHSDGWTPQNRWFHQQRSSPQSYGSNGLFSKSANHTEGSIPIVGGGNASNGDRSQLSFDIMDNLAGHLLGRDGKVINELQQMYNTVIQVMPKKKMAGQGGYRTVTITGSPTAVQATHLMIQQRLSAEEKRGGQSENGSPTSTGSSPQQQLPLSPSSQFA